MPLSYSENLALIPACLTLLRFSEKEPVPRTGIHAPKTRLPLVQPPPLVLGLNSSPLLLLLQICTSFKADLELSKIEHRLGAKLYLKKQEKKNN